MGWTIEVYSTSLSNYFSSSNRHCYHQPVPPLSHLLVCWDSSHYDHLDVNTISSLGPNISYFVPLGNKEWFTHNFAKYKHVREMDWWDEHTWKSSDEKKQLTIACTPCQHFSGRGIFDRNVTLWSSWTLLGTKRFFFGGYPQSTRFFLLFLSSHPHFLSISTITFAVLISGIPDIGLLQTDRTKKPSHAVQPSAKSAKNTAPLILPGTPLSHFPYISPSPPYSFSRNMNTPVPFPKIWILLSPFPKYEYSYPVSPI